MTGYFRPQWTDATRRFLDSADIEICWIGDAIDAGVIATHDDKLAIEKESRWDYPDDIVISACCAGVERAPDCDAVLQVGAGMRTSRVAAAIEEMTRKPLIATDNALHWAVLRAAGLSARRGHGSLLDGA